MILSKRLNSIVNMIPNSSNVIDVGCDHGLLDIYLSKYKDCSCIASDISKKCIDKTNNNIIKYQASNIITIVSDGLKNIAIKDEIIVISGMGTSTIKNIINGSINNDLIIQSNNDYSELREYFYHIGYSLFDEEVISDNNKFYITMYFKKKNGSISDDDILLGPFLKQKKSSIDYYKYLLDKYNKIIDNLPVNNEKRNILSYNIDIIEKTLDQLEI